MRIGTATLGGTLTTRTHARAGSVFQQGHKGLWAVSIEIFNPDGGKRRRKVFRSMSEQVVRDRLAAYLAQHPPREIAFRPTEYRKQAAAIKTRTIEELEALWVASTACAICQTALDGFNKTKDHVQAVAEGGHDGIENLQYLCWECNLAKSNRSTLTWDGPPRPYRALPRRQAHFDQVVSEGRDPHSLTIDEIKELGLRIR
jgi:5-methylcytosine-specific restriction endonuclease McrA